MSAAAGSQRAAATASGAAPAPSKPARIVLTGFMGAGKTTVGRLLALRLNWPFADVDTLIESNTGATIAQLFARHGEAWFRQREHETVAELLHSPRLILALGGGAIEDPRTRHLLLEPDLAAAGPTLLVHLEASLDTVLERCHGTEATRPVLADSRNLAVRYQRRLPLYRQAHLTITVDSLPPEAVVEAILAHTRFAQP